MELSCVPRTQDWRKGDLPFFPTPRTTTSNCRRRPSESSSTPAPKPSPFLRLPLEIRQQIYALVLPYTTTLDTQATGASTVSPRRYFYSSPAPLSPVNAPSTSSTSSSSDRPSQTVVWHHGNTAILAVCQAIHDEAAALLYGTNTFAVQVTYASIRFMHRWRIPASGLMPLREYSLLDHFSQRNLQRIRRYRVSVDYVDSYTGMVKYNCGGNGLPAGLKAQVVQLVSVMRAGDALLDLQIYLNDGTGTWAYRTVSHTLTAAKHIYPIRTGPAMQPQAVLEPFKALKDVRNCVLTGAVSKEYAAEVERRICT